MSKTKRLTVQEFADHVCGRPTVLRGHQPRTREDLPPCDEDTDNRRDVYVDDAIIRLTTAAQTAPRPLQAALLHVAYLLSTTPPEHTRAAAAALCDLTGEFR